MIEPFRELVEKRHENGRLMRERGGKVIGYFCSYCPEEILHAAGLVPVRIFGAPEPITHSDAYIQTYYCPYCRNCLDEALKGRYDYLNGLVMAYTCEHIRSAFQSWKVHLPMDFAWLVDMPGVINTSAARNFYMHELKNMVEAIEAHFGVKVSDEKLSHSIGIYNTHRNLIQALYEYRKLDPPLISGTEMYYVNVSGMVTPKEVHIELLKELLERLEGRTEAPRRGARLMIAGSALFNPDVFDTVEKQGAVIVTDDLCVGTRHYWGNVLYNGQGTESLRKETLKERSLHTSSTKKEEGPLSAICERYMNRAVCPNKHPADSRYERIINLAEEFKVQGVLIIHQKFCDPHEFDRPHIEAMLRRRKIPTAFVEIETTFSPHQIAVPVNALQDISAKKEPILNTTARP